MKFKTIALVVITAITMFTVGMYSQTVKKFDENKPTVYSGDNLGFRVTEVKGGIPSGSIVVRINGEWIRASTENVMGIHPVQSH